MAWECTLCGYTLSSVNPPKECPECGAAQEMLMWVQDDVVEEEEEGYGSELYEDEQDEEESEDLGEFDEERVPELGEELGVFFDPDTDDDLED